jgi:ABC-type lipoprotein export system ATPase subunit
VGFQGLRHNVVMLNNNNTATENEARISTLNREIGMLQQAQPFLHGCPARQNIARVIERQQELETLLAYQAVVARFGRDEIQRCEALSI